MSDSHSDNLGELAGDFKAQLRSLEARLSQLEQAVYRLAPPEMQYSAQLDNLQQCAADEDQLQSSSESVNDIAPSPDVRHETNCKAESVVLSKDRHKGIAERTPVTEGQIPGGSQTVSDAPGNGDRGQTGDSVAAGFALDKKLLPPQDLREPSPAGVGLEATIGSYWLNRIGLLALLIGIISLLLYSFQYFGAGLKISFGFVLAAALIYLSRSSWLSGRSWFAHGLNALGWSIAFFSGYAMYFVPDLKLFSSVLLELVILSGVAAGAMYDAIRYKSEFTASLSMILATVSICLAASSVNSFAGLLIVIAAAACVCVRQRWYSLLLNATVTFYAAFLLLYATDPSYGFHLGTWQALHPRSDGSLAVSLFAGWFVVHLASYFARQVPDSLRNRLVVSSTLNALCASSFLSLILQPLLFWYGVSEYVVANAALGSIYLITAILFKRRGAENLSTLHLLIGLSFINIAIWGRFTGIINAVLDVIQLGLLTMIGLRFRIKAFTWFAVALAIVTLLEAVQNGWVIGLLAGSVYAAVAYLYRTYPYNDEQSKKTYRRFSNFYFTLANLIAANVISILTQIGWGWQVVLWLVQTLANSAVLLRTRDQYIGVVTVILLIFNIVGWLVVTSAEVGYGTPMLLAILILYGFAEYCRNLHLQNPEPTEQNLKNVYGVFATVLLTVLILKSVPGLWLSLATGIEGMALVAAGFTIRERMLRISGLIIFAIMAVHLLFFDLASASTIARIISFIATGFLLVGCSYVYGWFSKSLSIPDKTSSNLPVSDGTTKLDDSLPN